MLTKLFKKSLESSIVFSGLHPNVISDVMKSVVSLDEAIKDEITSLFEKIKCPKGMVLTSSGSIPRHLYYLDEGSLVRMSIEREGTELTTGFATQYELACCYTSMALETPALCSMQMLTNGYVYRIKWADLLSLADKYPAVKTVEMFVHACYMKYMNEQANSLRFLSAKERYIWLVKTRPEIIKNVPLVYLAQYLGVSAECISRIRSGLRKDSDASFRKAVSIISGT